MSRKILVPCLLLATIASLIFALGIANANAPTPRDRMMKELDRIDKAITEFDDGKYKKQRMTEAIPVTYADKEGNIAATYYICKTTYYEADPDDITGLDVEAIVGIIDPSDADSEKSCMVNDMDAALYRRGERYYLCWTDTPEYSFVLEYEPDLITEAEIFRMAESVQRVEKS